MTSYLQHQRHVTKQISSSVEQRFDNGNRASVLDQTWTNYGPRVKSCPPVLLLWPTRTYTNLNSHRALSVRPLKIMDGSDFQKNKPRRCKIGIKNEVKNFYYGHHIRTWTVISEKEKKKGLHFVFQSACVPRRQQFFQIWPFV